MKRLGIFICHCGGNISDYIDVEKVREAVSRLPGVEVAKTTMFACSEAAQEEMVAAVKEAKLEGMVVASCSPRLHLHTFRKVAEMAGLNPYAYVHVNVREQCSWAHRKDPDGATRKAVKLIEAGAAKAALSEPLVRFRVETRPAVLVVGAGIAGLRAALSLSDMGLSVFVVEKEHKLGGWVGSLRKMYPGNRDGEKLVEDLLEKLFERDNVTIFTGAELLEKSGTVGDFTVKVRVRAGETLSLNVGAIVVATGFSPYVPVDGEFGFGSDRVMTLPDFYRLLSESDGAIFVDGKRVRVIAYIYCVGSRGTRGSENSCAREYCSRYCCAAAVHASITAGEMDGELAQYHFFRDVRTYGKLEEMYERSGRMGSVFVRFDGDEPPIVEDFGDGILVRARDTLAGGEEVELVADLVVLVTGMVPRENQQLASVLKLPVGTDGFYGEIHPKLRPVETVLDGIYIVGASQGPKTAPEAVASALAGVARCAATLLKGYVELEPFVAEVNEENCEWCGECEKVCPYGAIQKVSIDGREVAKVIETLCKGGGACAPVCPKSAIDLKGYRDAQIRAMIEAMCGEVGS